MQGGFKVGKSTLTGSTKRENMLHVIVFHHALYHAISISCEPLPNPRDGRGHRFDTISRRRLSQRSLEWNHEQVRDVAGHRNP
jgi:hypothetical protein